MKDILEILNPCHLPTVEDFRKIALASPFTKYIEGRFIQLQSRFEELTLGKWVVEKHPENLKFLVNDEWKDTCHKVFQPALLKKEHFVCEVIEPIEDHYDSNKYEYNKDINEYTEAQSKVWFEGDFGAGGFKHLVGSDNWNFSDNENNLWIDIEGIARINDPTVFDFVYYIDRYNRTAKEKININWTENFVKLLK